MDLTQILTWLLSSGSGSLLGFFAAQRKASFEAKLTEAQITKLKSDITLEWIKELQARLKELEESNDLKEAEIEQLQAIIRSKRLPKPD
jgi:hypothetical protein